MIRWKSRRFLKKALAKGLNVVGYDANSQPDARKRLINQAQFKRHRQGDGRLRSQGKPARKGVCIVNSTFTTPIASWSPKMSATPRQMHPKLNGWKR